MDTFVRIVPDGTLLFRDSRPFAEGAEARTLPFPIPSTIAGAVRTAIGRSVGYDFVDPATKRTQIDDVMKWAIHGPVLELGGCRYYPAPFDAHVTRDSVYSRRPLDLVGSGTNVPSGLLPCGLEPVLSAEAGKPDWEAPMFWPEPLMFDWLSACGEVDRSSFRKELQEHGFSPAVEHRTGVAIDPDGLTAADGMLFGIERLQIDAMSSSAGYMKGSFLVRMVSSLANITDTMGRVGGEGGFARFSVVDSASWPSLPSSLATNVSVSRRLRMQLVTPGLFANGFAPAEISGLRLVGACVPRWLPVSGWDYENNRAKALRRMAPAGSVYFFEVLDGFDVAAFVSDCWMKPFADDDSDRKSGFGLAVWGVW